MHLGQVFWCLEQYCLSMAILARLMHLFSAQVLVFFKHTYVVGIYSFLALCGDIFLGL